MTIAIPSSRDAEIDSASATLGTAELKRHIALMFGDPLPAQMLDSCD